jgi:hypothetical protein
MVFLVVAVKQLRRLAYGGYLLHTLTLTQEDACRAGGEASLP